LHNLSFVCPLNPDPLALIERDPITGAVVEFGEVVRGLSCAAMNYAFSSVPPASI